MTDKKEVVFSSTWQRHKAGACKKDCWYCKDTEVIND